MLHVVMRVIRPFPVFVVFCLGILRIFLDLLLRRLVGPCLSGFLLCYRLRPVGNDSH